jgi:hypothetical protein
VVTNVPVGRAEETVSSVDLDRLLECRVVVARIGEMDLAKWWNTKGQLGPIGASVLRRGFPRTFRFAAARSVFAVAAARCDEVFTPPKCVTLWNLPAEVEDQFDARWEHWIDHRGEWEPFFCQVEGLKATEVSEALAQFEIVHAGDLERFSRLKRSAEGKAVMLPGIFDGGNDDVALLALGFGRGEVGKLTVPYMQWEP